MSKKDKLFENPSLEDKLLLRSQIKNLIDGTFEDIEVADEDGNVKTIDFMDVMTNRDLAPLMSETISKVLIEEIEPASVIYNTFFQEAKVERASSVQFQTSGPLVAGAVGHNGTYPTVTIGFGQTGDSINIPLQKYGLAIKIDNEVIEENLIDIVGIFLSKGKNALVRNREALAIGEILRYGITEIDNSSTTIRKTTGRDIKGTPNGTMTANDLMYIYTKAMIEGIILDTIIMHPFAWQLFMTDAEMKEIVFANNTLVSFRPPNGGLMNRFSNISGNKLGTFLNGTGNPTMNPALGKLQPDSYVQTWLANQASLNIPAPSYMPTPLTIIVSPLMPIRTVNGVYITDVVFGAASETGLVLRKKDPIVEEYNSVENDYLYVRMKEIFGIGIMNQGKSIRIAKNIVIDKNFVFDNVNSASLDPIDQSQAQV